MATFTPHRIVLISHGRHDEKVISADVYPGMYLQIGTDDKVAPHAVAGGDGQLIVCEENALAGATAPTKIAYSASVPEVAPIRRPVPGDKLLMLLASGQNVTEGTPLVSAGNGTLTAASPETLITATLYQILAASTDITNTAATAQTFSNGTYAIPINTLKAGDVVHIRGKVVVSAENGTNTHNVIVKIGSTTLATCGAVQLAAGNFATFDIVMTIRTIGGSGTFVADVVTVVNPGGTPTETTATVASTTLDTTSAAAQTLTVTVTPSAQSSGNVAALQEFQVDLQRAGGSAVKVYADEACNNSANAGSSPMSDFTNAAFIRVIVK